jgi:hypothetical protein
MSNLQPTVPSFSLTPTTPATPRWWQHPMGLSRMIRGAALSILLCAAYGALWGMVAGGLAGTCVFPLIGTLIGGVCGIPFGVAAGMLGGIFGGRWGWALGGAVSGFGGGIALSMMTSLLREDSTGYHTSSSPLLFLALCGPSILGWLLGYWLGSRLEPETFTNPESTQGRLQEHLEESALYQMPLYARIVVGALMVLSAASALIQINNMSK